MKKIFCLSLAFILCLAFAGCSKKIGETKSITNSSLQLLYETKDRHGNILTQTFYNTKTNEYWLREYTYTNDNICSYQQTTVIETAIAKPNCNGNGALKIYYNSTLTNGPITIMDNKYIKISAIEYLTKNSWWEFGYKLEVVNKTNQVITVSIDGCSIMDINCKPMFSIDHIDAGNTAYFTLAWDKETLERCHIPYIDNTEFMIRVYDNENWMTPALVGERVLIKQ